MKPMDAHCHFWDPARGDYGWLEQGGAALDPLRRAFGPDELLALNGGTEVIAVQAAPTEAETLYLFDLATRHPQIRGVVGWTDLSAPDAARRIAALTARGPLVGLRPMLQDLSEDDWIVTRARPDAIGAMQALELRFDALVLPRQLQPLAAFAARYPDLPIVIDHVAKPSALLAGEPQPGWREGMRIFAERPGTYCKFSGLLTEFRASMAPEHALAALRPLLADLLDWFGADRLMWGSDWPVLTLAAPYGDWRQITDELLAPLSAAERAAILGGNARDFYGIGEGSS